MRHSIGMKFGAALFVAALAPTAYFGYHDFASERERLTDQKLRELYVNCVSRAKSMERMFINAYSDLNDMRTALPLRFLMDVPDDRPDAIPYWRSLVEQEFHRFLSLKTDYSQIGLIDERGDEQVVLLRNGDHLLSRSPDELKNRFTAPHFVAVASIERYGIAASPMRDAADPRRSLDEVTLLRYTAWVYDKEGNARYVIYVDVNGAHAEYSLTDLSFEMPRPVALLTGMGRYLFNPGWDLQGEKADGAGLPNIRDQYTSEVTSQILSGRSGVISDDPEALYAYVTIRPQVGNESFSYVLFDRYERSGFAPALAPLRKRYLIGAAAALGLSLLLAVSVSRALTRHLRRLRSGVERMATRDMGEKIEIRSGDEIERLADAYNDMASSLNEYYTSLEQKVAERTEQVRQVEKRLAQAQKLASIGFLAAGVAHEINNPVAVILTRIELLRQGAWRNADAVAEKDLGVIAHHAQRIGEIAGGLLTFARPRTDRVGPVDVNGVVRRMCELMIHPVEKKGVHLTADISSSPLMAVAAQTGLEQALYNLVYNAYQATPTGGAIVVSTGENREGVEIRVTDTGSGIASNDLERVFDPFFTTKEPGEGTGLGLSVSYGFIKEYGGVLSVESVQGDGARFTIWLQKPAGATASLAKGGVHA